MLYIILYIVILALLTNCLKKEYEKSNKEAEQEKTDYQEYQTNPIYQDNISDEDFKKAMLQKADSINRNLTELNKKQEKQKKELNEIKGDVGCITFIIFVPALIGVAIILLSIISGYNILNNL